MEAKATELQENLDEQDSGDSDMEEDLAATQKTIAKLRNEM